MAEKTADFALRAAETHWLKSVILLIICNKFVSGGKYRYGRRINKL